MYVHTVSLRRISFFLEIRSPRSVITPFFPKRPLSPPPKKNAPLAKPLSACKYKTTFTSNTKIVLRFSSCFIFSSSSTMPTMTSSASHDAYDTLISLRDKLTCLNGVITLKAVDKLEDELNGIFTNRDKSTTIWRVRSPRASTGSSLATPPGTTRYSPIQEHTLPTPSQQAMQPQRESSLWRNTRSNRRATGIT